MKNITLLASLFIISACAGSAGYTLTAYTPGGKKLNKKSELSSNKTGIPMMRNTLCRTYPNAVIRIRDGLGREVTEYSPHSCR